MNTKETATISIALCTYNGEAYLSAQWQSLLEQTLLPDEVIVCDDASTDETVSLLHELADKAPFRVQIITNPVQLGFNKNFEQALSLCSSDLVFICDQDDLWLPEKIQVMASHMSKFSNLQIAFNNAWLVDEQLKPLHRLFWDQVRFDKTAQKRWQAGEALDILLDGNRMMGCASVIRRKFLPKILPIPNNVPGYIYDGWIAMIGAAVNAIDFIDQPLQLYRIHIRQQVGVRQDDSGRTPIKLKDRFVRNREIKLAPLQEKHDQLQTIYRLISERVPPDAPGIKQIKRRIDHYHMRSTLSDNHASRLIPVLSNVWQGNYQRFADASANWFAPYLTALGDILE